MATPVWIIACKQQPNVSSNLLSSQCPTSERVAIQSTLEFFAEPVQEELDPVTVGAVFSIAFSVVVLFYLVARGAGSVLRLIRFG